MARSPSPEADYSLFLSENGHLSFENPNYQVTGAEREKGCAQDFSRERGGGRRGR